MKPVPITSAKYIADRFGYDQVIVYARKIGTDPETSGEHITTYGVDAEHASVAARIAEALKELLGWTKETK